jgi:hypothetical protein
MLTTILASERCEILGKVCLTVAATAFVVFVPQFASNRTSQLAFPTVGIAATLGLGLFISLFADKLVYLVVILTLACCGLLFANYLSK